MSLPEHAAIGVRGTEADDWEAIAEILQGENVVYHTLQIPFLSRDEVRERSETPRPHFHGLVAVLDEQVIGLLGLHIGQGRQAHMAHLGMMVHADFQGQGAGHALMAAALDLAENWLALSRVELTVFVDNEPAIRLYEKFGFVREGVLRDYAWRAGQYVDACLMARCAAHGAGADE